MKGSSSEIRRAVKEYVLRECLPGERPEVLNDDTPLISGGILDSIKVTKLVIFLEELHGVEFQPHEVSVDHLDTVARIASTIQAKMAGSA